LEGEKMRRITRKEAQEKIVDLKDSKEITLNFLDTLSDDDLIWELDLILIEKGRFFEKYKIQGEIL
jgi:hypothetical protein